MKKISEKLRFLYCFELKSLILFIFYCFLLEIQYVLKKIVCLIVFQLKSWGGLAAPAYGLLYLHCVQLEGGPPDIENQQFSIDPY